MIEIFLDPDLRLGPLVLTWHGIFTAVGILFGVALPIRLVRRRVSDDDGYAIATWGVVGGIVGARLFHVLDRFEQYAREPLQILAIWTGGIAVWGAVIGGVVAGYVTALRRRVPIGWTADAAASGIGLGLALGRIGDVINGEHHATECTVGLCVGYTHPATLGQPGPVHLAIGYEMVWVLASVALALVLFLRRERTGVGLPPGAIFWLWTFLYGLGRFAISFLRVGEPTSVFALRQDQLVGLIAMALAAAMLAVLAARARGAGRTTAVA